MKRTLIAMIGLAALVSVGGSTRADDDTANALVHHFPLRVRAVLARATAPTPTPHPIRFNGPGRATATPHGVKLVFDVLDRHGCHGEAHVRWDNPLEYRPERPHFVGKGVAEVRLPHHQFEFRIWTKGTIIRAQTGDLILAGRFRSIEPSVDGARFYGHYVGIEQ